MLIKGVIALGICIIGSGLLTQRFFPEMNGAFEFGTIIGFIVGLFAIATIGSLTKIKKKERVEK